MNAAAMKEKQLFSEVTLVMGSFIHHGEFKLAQIERVLSKASGKVSRRFSKLRR